MHQDMAAHASVRSIKRQFYGLEVEVKILDKAKSFVEQWSDTFTSAVIFFLYFFVGCLFYRHVEGWDSLTCMYFQVVTMTTVGYGDFSPQSQAARLAFSFYVSWLPPLTPYTLHPTLYTLHPRPYTRYPTLYTLYSNLTAW